MSPRKDCSLRAVTCALVRELIDNNGTLDLHEFSLKRGGRSVRRRCTDIVIVLEALGMLTCRHGKCRWVFGKWWLPAIYAYQLEVLREHEDRLDAAIRELRVARGKSRCIAMEHLALSDLGKTLKASTQKLIALSETKDNAPIRYMRLERSLRVSQFVGSIEEIHFARDTPAVATGPPQRDDSDEQPQQQQWYLPDYDERLFGEASDYLL